MKPPDESNTLSFPEIQPLLEALQRDVPAAVGSSSHPLLAKDPLLRIVLRNQARMAALTLDTIRLAAAHRDRDEERPPLILAALSPLVRELLDQVFTFAFLFEDLPARWLQFKKGGWRDARRQNEVLHRHDKDPAWQASTQAHDVLLAILRRDAGITSDEEKDGGKVRWPNPGGMVSACRTTELRDYLTHLDEWFYREVSQSSHVQLLGIFAEGAYLLFSDGPPGPARHMVVEQKRAGIAFRGIGLTLAAFSELEIGLGLGLAGRLTELWTKGVSVQPEIRELFTMRYEAKLATKSERVRS